MKTIKVVSDLKTEEFEARIREMMSFSGIEVCKWKIDYAEGSTQLVMQIKELTNETFLLEGLKDFGIAVEAVEIKVFYADTGPVRSTCEP